MAIFSIPPPQYTSGAVFVKQNIRFPSTLLHFSGAVKFWEKSRLTTRYNGGLEVLSRKVLPNQFVIIYGIIQDSRGIILARRLYAK